MEHQHSPAARVDALLEKIAQEYRALGPTRDAAFREALGRLNLPGGLRRRGTQPRSLSQSLNQENTDA